MSTQPRRLITLLTLADTSRDTSKWVPRSGHRVMNGTRHNIRGMKL